MSFEMPEAGLLVRGNRWGVAPSRGLKQPRHFVRVNLEAGLGADDPAYAMG